MHDLQAGLHFFSQKPSHSFVPGGQVETHFLGSFSSEVISYLKPSAHSRQLWSYLPLHDLQAGLHFFSQKPSHSFVSGGQVETHFLGSLSSEVLSYFKPSAHSRQLLS